MCEEPRAWACGSRRRGEVSVQHDSLAVCLDAGDVIENWAYGKTYGERSRIWGGRCLVTANCVTRAFSCALSLEPPLRLPPYHDVTTATILGTRVSGSRWSRFLPSKRGLVDSTQPLKLWRCSQRSRMLWIPVSCGSEWPISAAPRCQQR